MKLYQMIIIILVITSCSSSVYVVKGTNGHSLVSMFQTLNTGSLECSNGGTRLDVYLDLDDNLTANSGDTYQSSLFACNGLDGKQGNPGEQGPQGNVGPQGESGVGEQGPQGNPGLNGNNGTISVYNLSSGNCTSIGDGYYAKKSSSDKAKIYNTSSCTAQSMQTELGNGSDSYWLTISRLAFIDTNNGINLRVIEWSN